MPSSVRSIILAAGRTHDGKVRWGDLPPERRGGIYIVSLWDDPDRLGGSSTAPVSMDRIEQLLEVRPNLRVDAVRPSPLQLGVRLQDMWLPDESVLYVGKATSIRSRVRQYYTTQLGARSPHAGGWPVKMLDCLDDLWVHYSVSPRPELAEQVTLAAFVDNVSAEAKTRLHDPAHPYPYANLEGPGGRKRHGIAGARAPRKSGTGRRVSPGKPRKERPMEPPTPTSRGGVRTQRVTEADIRAGRIRIPKESKTIFPPGKSDIDIVLRGQRYSARWDPRVGPYRERSGVVRVGRSAMRAVMPDEILKVNREGDLWRFD